MKKQKPIETYQELVSVLTDLFNEVEPETPEEINAVLREAGYDPEEVAADARAAAERALADSSIADDSGTKSPETEELDRSILQIEQDILNPVDEQIAALLLLQSAVRARYANQFSKAIDYAAQSKAVWEGLGEMAGAATALVALGDVAYVQGNWSEAEESYDQARGIMESLDIHPGTNNARRYAQVLWAYSRVLTHKRQYQKALGLIEKAQQAAAGDSFGLAICKQLAGYVYLELGRFSRARSSFNEAVVCSRRAGHFHSEAQSLVALASVALSEDCLDEVMKYLEEAQEVAQQEGFQDILEQIDDIRSDCRQMVKV